MNQRPGKTHKAAMPQDGKINLFDLIDFMEMSGDALRKEGNDDAAFYFDQAAEYLRINPHKGLKEGPARILGL